jgi:hypothetical protein
MLVAVSVACATLVVPTAPASSGTDPTTSTPPAAPTTTSEPDAESEPAPVGSDPTVATSPDVEAPTIEAATVDLDALPPADDTAWATAASSPQCLCSGWNRTVDLPLTGEMVNIIWEGAPDHARHTRSRTHSRSDWQVPALDDDESPDAGSEGLDDDRHVLGPVWTGPGTDQIEIRVVSGSARSLELEVLHSVVPEGWDPGPPTAVAGGVVPGGADAPSATQPVIFNRSQWGSGPWRSDHAGCAGGPFYASELRFGVVHHTVSTNSYSPAQAFSLVQGVYYTHTNTNGWCDIGYNFLVDKYGQTFEGRSMSLYGPVIGGHAKGFNYASVGVALLGQYHPGSSPPAAGVTGSQLASTAAVMAWKFDFYGVNPHTQTLEISGGSTSIPEGQPVWLNRVSGHRDMGATACPGNNAYNLLPQLRNDIKSRQVPTTFSDVPRSHTFYTEIEWAWRNHLVSGFTDGTFRPHYWLLRQEIMIILYRFAASPAGPFPNPGFSDVPTNHFAYKAIAWAVHTGVTTGYPDGSFQTTLWVPREAMVAFLYRQAGSPAGPFPNPGFKDVKINHPMYKEIAWAVHNNVVDGFGDNTFRGGDPVSRQFAAAFMERYAKRP